MKLDLLFRVREMNASAFSRICDFLISWSEPCFSSGFSLIGSNIQSHLIDRNMICCKAQRKQSVCLAWITSYRGSWPQIFENPYTQIGGADSYGRLLENTAEETVKWIVVGGRAVQTTTVKRCTSSGTKPIIHRSLKFTRN